MPRVLCKLPNASAFINGVAFEAVEDGMLSAEIGEAEAANFALIPGYELVDGGKRPEPAPAPETPRDPADANGDGKVSAAERRAANKKTAQPQG